MIMDALRQGLIDNEFLYFCARSTGGSRTRRLVQALAAGACCVPGGGCHHHCMYLVYPCRSGPSMIMDALSKGLIDNVFLYFRAPPEPSSVVRSLLDLRAPEGHRDGRRQPREGSG